MEANKKLRAFGLTVTSIASFYYVYEIYLYIANWKSEADIQAQTSCTEIFMLEIWLMTQNILWLAALLILIIVLAFPEIYKLLLCFLYIMGPLYFTWSVVSLGYYSAFMNCCRKTLDECVKYYPYTNPASFVLLLIVSLLFSAMLSIYLLVLVGHSMWRHFCNRYQQYATLLG